MRAEYIRTSERRVLGSNASPQVPRRCRAFIQARSSVVVAVVGILGERADRHEQQIVRAQVHAAGLAIPRPVDARGLLAPFLPHEVHIGHFSAVLEPHAVLLQPLHQRKHQRFVLVVLGELQRREVRQPTDMVDEAMQVELHLQRRVPFLEREHRAPVQPEIAVQEIAAQHFVDALVLHLLPGSQEQRDDVLLRLLAQGEQAIGMRVLAPVDGGTLQRIVRVVLVQPVELVQHTGIVDLQRRNRAEQIPQALEMVFHLAAAADHETLLRHLQAIQRATGNLLLLQDGDALAGHAPIAHQERRTGQRGQARADEPGRLVVHAGRLARACEGLVIATAVIHARLLPGWGMPTLALNRCTASCREAATQ
ncbi:hypothetical protein D3C72_1239860 [compost metagenome]